MATNGKAWAQGSATHAARVLRNMLAAIVGQPTASHANAVTAPASRLGSFGVVGENDFKVTTTGSLGYSVAAGRIVATGTFATAQGAYAGYNDAAVTGSFSARHATLSRTDLVCYRTRDTDEDATTFEDDGIVVVEGVAGSGTPAVPSSLGSLVVLAEVTVPSTANGGALTFTDRRPFVSAVGGRIQATSGNRPSSPRLGDEIFERDTLRPRIWTGTWDIQDRGYVIRYGGFTGTTGALGNLDLTYGFTYSTTPAIFIQVADDIGQYALLDNAFTTTTGFRAIMRFQSGNAVVNAGATRIFWASIGPV